MTKRRGKKREESQKEREEMPEEKKNNKATPPAEKSPDYKCTTYEVHGENAPLDAEFVATQGEIDSLATKIHSEINIDPSKFTKAKLKKLAVEVGKDIFDQLFNSDARVLNQNRLNNLHLLKELKEDPDREAERLPYRCWRSNFDELEKALSAKKYTFLQVNGDRVRKNDTLWLRKIVRQCYRPYAVVELMGGCNLNGENLPEIPNLTLDVDADWAKVIELAKERHKIKAIHKALEHMSENGEMEPREVRFQVKHEVLEIEKERERDLEQKRMEQRENVVRSFQHQIDRTKSRQDAINTGLANIGKQVGEITEALNGGKEVKDGEEELRSRFDGMDMTEIIRQMVKEDKIDAEELEEALRESTSSAT
jgi:hypothetical protein